MLLIWSDKNFEVCKAFKDIKIERIYHNKLNLYQVSWQVSESEEDNKGEKMKKKILVQAFFFSTQQCFPFFFLKG